MLLLLLLLPEEGGHACAANLSYAALQLNADLGFSRTVYGLGSGDFSLMRCVG